MNIEITDRITPPEGDVTLSAMVLLGMLKIVSEEAAACSAAAREAVSLSVVPESGYERAQRVYMGLLGISGKVSAMIVEMSPRLEALQVIQAQEMRARINPTSH